MQVPGHILRKVDRARAALGLDHRHPGGARREGETRDQYKHRQAVAREVELQRLRELGHLPPRVPELGELADQEDEKP